MTALANFDSTIGKPLAPASSGRAVIVVEASRRLRHSGYSALADISCDVVGSSLRLSGRLPSHYLKQVAQAIGLQVEGVHRVINLIEVDVPVGT